MVLSSARFFVRPSSIAYFGCNFTVRSRSAPIIVSNFSHKSLQILNERDVLRNFAVSSYNRPIQCCQVSVSDYHHLIRSISGAGSLVSRHNDCQHSKTNGSILCQRMTYSSQRKIAEEFYKHFTEKGKVPSGLSMNESKSKKSKFRWPKHIGEWLLGIFTVGSVIYIFFSYVYLGYLEKDFDDNKLPPKK